MKYHFFHVFAVGRNRRSALRRMCPPASPAMPRRDALRVSHPMGCLWGRSPNRHHGGRPLVASNRSACGGYRDREIAPTAGLHRHACAA